MHSTVFGPTYPPFTPTTTDTVSWTTSAPTYKYAIDEVENGFILYYNNSTYVFSSLNKIFTFLKKEEQSDE